MLPTHDILTDIPTNREKFFGCSGKMLCPCLATVATLLHEIPPQKVLPFDRLCKELATRHHAEVTCPSTTRQILKALATDPTQTAPYWRILKTNGELFAFLPVGTEAHSQLLQKEGITLDITGKTPKVKNIRESLPF